MHVVYQEDLSIATKSRHPSVVIDPGLGQEFSWDNGKRGPRGCLIFTLAEIR